MMVVGTLSWKQCFLCTTDIGMVVRIDNVTLGAYLKEQCVQ